jgi:hypothetical protein
MNRHYPTGTILLLVSTASGLFLCSSRDRKQWMIEETSLKNAKVYHAAFDPRNGYRLFASDNSANGGPVLRYSDDFGQTWREPRTPLRFPAESGWEIENIWLIEPGRTSEPETLYAGTAPAALWISRDRGETWEPDAALLHHPTRGEWIPGAGGMCLHSIVPDYDNPQRMWVAASSIGTLRTENGGKTWEHINKNVGAEHFPPPQPPFGTCVHRLIQHPTQPDVLYQQNHNGQYKSLNGGDDWISIQNNLPSYFGFPIALDRHRPETIYTAVVVDDGRYNVNNQFTVYRSTNAGEHWQELTEGLPGGEGVRLGVLRHGLCADTLDPCGIYVGTNTGQLFASNNRGDNWQQIADFLPRINAVTATVLV